MHGYKDPEISKINYAAVMGEVLSLVLPSYQGQKVRLSYQAPDELYLTIDPEKLKLALVNLVHNSLEASLPLNETDPSGEVLIEQEQEERKNGIITRVRIYQTGILPSAYATKLNSGVQFSTKGEKGNGKGASGSFNYIKKVHGGGLRYVPNERVKKEGYHGLIEITL